MSTGVGITLKDPFAGSYTAEVKVPALNWAMSLPEPAISSTLPFFSTTACIDRTGFLAGITSHLPLAHSSVVPEQTGCGGAAPTSSSA